MKIASIFHKVFTRFLSKFDPLKKLKIKITSVEKKIETIFNRIENQMITLNAIQSKLSLINDQVSTKLTLINEKVTKISIIHIEDQKILLAKNLLIEQVKLKSKNIQDYEFKVFSQWGDDGIIQFLIRNTKILNNNFIEFGVEDYSESNTRFLLMNNNWSGYIIDGSEKAVASISKQPYFWKYDIRPVFAWITKENINILLNKPNWQDIGILSIDIDGNDYWIWKELDISKLRPTIVILEYNSVFGKEKALTIPYKNEFYRTDAHFSNLYFGATLKALVELSKEKGYIFVGSNSNGNNAYFVKKDRLNNSLLSVSAEGGYVESKFRESRDKNGNLNFDRDKKRKEIINDLPVYNIETKKIEKLKSIKPSI